MAENVSFLRDLFCSVLLSAKPAICEALQTFLVSYLGAGCRIMFITQDFLLSSDAGKKDCVHMLHVARKH